MIDHIGISVSDYDKSKAFYLSALAPIGYQLYGEYGDWAGLGIEGSPDFWIQKDTQTTPLIHVAFRVKNRASVDAFYEAALKAGGKDNGAPGIREMYHPNYYGAFVFDPDGHNVEVVCHEAEG